MLFNFFQKNRREFLKKRLTRQDYAYLFDKPTDGEWVCLDIEMTGLDSKKDCILSVGAVKIIKNNKGLMIDTANTLSIICRPPTMPSTNSIVVHGLRPIDVENGVDYNTLLQQLLPFIANRPIVGFCPNLDMAFINALAKPFLGVPLSNPLLDVSSLDQQIRYRHNPDTASEKRHLTELLKAYKIPLLPAHDSLNDALMTAMLFCCLLHK